MFFFTDPTKESKGKVIGLLEVMKVSPSVQEEASMHALDEAGTWFFLFLSLLPFFLYYVSYASFH